MLNKITLNKRAFLTAFLVLVFLLSLCFKVYGQGFIPAETFKNIIELIKLDFSKIFRTDYYSLNIDKVMRLPYYPDTIRRLEISVVSCLGGMAISVGGAIFQTMFKNPLASPNMIGISTGVSLGNVLFVYTLGTAAVTTFVAETTRYIYCFVCSSAMILLLLFLGKIAGIKTKQFSIMDMIILGSIISRLIGALVTYLEYALEDMDINWLMLYQQYSMGTAIPSDMSGILTFIILFLISIIPVVLIRFRFNALSFEDDDIRYMGINPSLLRLVGMICGSILSVTALVFCGEVGMVSMVVPHMCRYSMGADFRKVCINSMLLGGILTLISRMLTSVITFDGMFAPANFFLSIIILPAFVYALTKQRSAFEE